MNRARHTDVVVLGAGVSGIYQIKRLVDLGIDAVVIEGEDDLGGTWYRNRYPGCRFDSESYTYGYSFSTEVLDEWHWKERFSSQPENLRYLNFVVDKFDLRRHMRFGSRVERMAWDDSARHWHLRLSDGSSHTARFVITSLGPLSAPTLPSYEGMDAFEGDRWKPTTSRPTTVPTWSWSICARRRSSTSHGPASRPATGSVHVEAQRTGCLNSAQDVVNSSSSEANRSPAAASAPAIATARW